MFYDFKCENCKEVIEIQKGMNDPSPKNCPKCGSDDFHRIFTNPVATVYNCNGFYDTDSRSVKSR